MKSLPNMLTVLRLLLVPVIGWLLMAGHITAAGILFILAGLTDALDGFLARRWGQITRIGQLLDPLADKALLSVATIGCALLGLLPIWFALLMVTRDGLILAGAFLTRALKVDYEILPNFFGKLSVATQMLLLALILLPWPAALNVQSWTRPLILAAATLSILSAALYVFAWLRCLGRSQPGGGGIGAKLR